MNMLWFKTVLVLLATTATGVATQVEPSSSLMIGSLALLGGAVLLFLLEIFVPSGGILALICAACVVASVVVMFMYNGMLGVLMLVGYIVVIPVALYWGIRIWERSPLGRKLILGAEEEWTTSEESLARSEDARQDRVSSIKELIGQVGITDSSLRPIGFVRIAGQRLDAIAEGDMIEAGQSVKVVDAYDNQLKVRPVDAQDESKPESG